MDQNNGQGFGQENMMAQQPVMNAQPAMPQQPSYGQPAPAQANNSSIQLSVNIPKIDEGKLGFLNTLGVSCGIGFGAYLILVIIGRIILKI